MRRQRGDTIIEVLLAVTVFGILAVGTMVVMNRGAAIAERSLEITLARQEVDAQAEMLRYVHSRYSDVDNKDSYYNALWQSLRPAGSSGAIEKLGASSCPESEVWPDSSFALRPVADRISKVSLYKPAETYAKVHGDTAYGIYVTLVKVQGGHAYDAYVQACWHGVNGGLPQTTGTIVRLYDAKA